MVPDQQVSKAAEVRRPGARRRGVVVLIFILVLSAFGLAGVAVLGSSGDDASTSLAAVQSERAFFAAESGWVVVVHHLIEGDPPPPAGTAISFGAGDQTATIHAAPAVGESGEIVVSGSAGDAARWVTLYVE